MPSRQKQNIQLNKGAKGQMTKGYILGIDQGGTKTCAAVMDFNGNILSYHRTGGCYFPNDGLENAMGYIFDATDNVLKGAKVSENDIDIVVAGVTGIDWDGDDDIIADALRVRFANQEIVACNDCEIAYYSGALNPVGAVICAGTGVNVAIIAPDDQKFVLGDYMKSSIQGGSAISRRAIEAVFDSEIGAFPATKLTKLFLDFSNETSVFGLLQRYITEEGFLLKIISLVPQIIGLANNGDFVAQEILTSFSDDLCRCFVAAMDKMNMLDIPCDIILAGSIFKGQQSYLTKEVVKTISQSAKSANIIGAKFHPLVGACILGMIKKSENVTEQIHANIAVSAEKFELLGMIEV